MNKKRNKKKSYRDKKKDKKNFHPSDGYSAKNHNSNFKVLSTNVTKKEENSSNSHDDTNSKNNNTYARDGRKQNKFFNSRNTNSHNRAGASAINENDFFNRRNKNQNRPSEPKKRPITPYSAIYLEKKVCAVCNAEINYMSSAIEDKNKELFYHFDCIVKDLKKAHQLNPSERLVYLGSDTFAVIEDVKENGKMRFVIKKKIPLNNSAT